jgi:hypothetical protein
MSWGEAVLWWTHKAVADEDKDRQEMRITHATLEGHTGWLLLKQHTKGRKKKKQKKKKSKGNKGMKETGAEQEGEKIVEGEWKV